MDKDMPKGANKLQERIPAEYKQLWSNIPLSLRRTFIVIFIVLIISAFFSILYFTDGLEELLNMSRQVKVIEE